MLQRVEGFSGTGFMFLELAMSCHLHKISGTLSKHSFKILELKADTFTATFSCVAANGVTSQGRESFWFRGYIRSKIIISCSDTHYYCQRHASPTT